jgi:hypothetical protein
MLKEFNWPVQPYFRKKPVKYGIGNCNIPAMHVFATRNKPERQNEPTPGQEVVKPLRGAPVVSDGKWGTSRASLKK